MSYVIGLVCVGRIQYYYGKFLTKKNHNKSMYDVVKLCASLANNFY